MSIEHGSSPEEMGTIQENKKDIGHQEIKRPEISELREPLQHLLFQLQEHIKHKDYSLIVGDDVSGRIPTLIIGRVMAKVYESDGAEAPKTIFFAGKGGGLASLAEERVNQENLKRHFEKMLSFFAGSGSQSREERTHKLEKLKQRALVVTETIATGGALLPAVKVLKELGIPYDISSLALSGEVAPQMEKKLGSKIFWGSRKPVYSSHGTEGVVKDRAIPESVVSRLPYRESEDERSRIKRKEKVLEARRDVDVLSNELAAWYQDLPEEKAQAA